MPIRKTDNEIIEIADYVISNHATTRQTAEKFGIGTTTVRDYMLKRLPTINAGKANQVAEVWRKNQERAQSQCLTDARIIDMANFIILNHATISEAAVQFDIAESTIKHYIKVRLPKLNPYKAECVERIKWENAESVRVRNRLLRQIHSRGCGD